MQAGLVKILVSIVALAVAGAAYAQDSSQTPEEEMSVEEFLQRLSSVRKVLNRRDPFEENNPSYVKEDAPITIGEARLEINNEEQPPLERYPVEAYTVKAVLLGDRYPRALLQLPGGGSVIVEEKMRLGDKNGIIEKIDRTGLKVVEKIKNNFGSFDDITQQLLVGASRGTGAQK